MNQQTWENAFQLATKINLAAKKTGKKILLIASSDFSHFETPMESIRKDQLVIDEILQKKSKGVEQVVKNSKVSVCGYGPIMALMAFSEMLDPNYTVQLLRKGNSGDSFPSDKVVGYASFLTYHFQQSDCHRQGTF